MESVNSKVNKELEYLKSYLARYFDFVDNVYVIPHKNMDFDALGAAAGMCELCLNKGKNSFIVTDDEEEMMEVNLRKIFNTLKTRYDFISTNNLKNIRIDSSKELVIIVDINKSFLIPIEDMLPSFENVVVVDHHKVEEHTINSNCSLIEPEMSSASEIVYNLMKKFNIKPYPYLANALYAGIYLDTRRLGKLNEYISMTVAELMHYGASHEEVKRLFNKTDFCSIREEKRLMHELIDSTEIIANNYAISYNHFVPSTVYSRELLSKTADELVENYDVSTSFVIGFIDNASKGDNHSNIIHISARSSSIDVSSVMRLIGGGGRPEAAAADFFTDDIVSVDECLKDALIRSLKLYDYYEEQKQLVLMPMDTKKHF